MTVAGGTYGWVLTFTSSFPTNLLKSLSLYTAERLAQTTQRAQQTS
jgi:hypothetical protein